MRPPPLPVRWAGVGAAALGALGAVAGLVVGLIVHPQTAPFAMVELGLPATLVGGLVGLGSGMIVRAARHIGARRRGAARAGVGPPALWPMVRHPPHHLPSSRAPHMTPLVRGRLPSAVEPPELGERSEEIARIDGTVIEHIVSGNLAAPVDYDQAHDEWVVVLDGAAVLEVEGERVDLGSGDWVLLSAHVPHRLVETLPGTSWLALHAAERRPATSRT